MSCKFFFAFSFQYRKNAFKRSKVSGEKAAQVQEEEITDFIYSGTGIQSAVDDNEMMIFFSSP